MLGWPRKQRNDHRKTLRVGGGILALAIVPILKARTARADNTCGDVKTFFNWGCDTSGGEQVTPVLITIINWMALGVTVAVIGGIIYGGIMYSTSGGSPEQSKKAQGIIRNAIIALILYFAMWAILQFLVPGGLFT